MQARTALHPVRVLYLCSGRSFFSKHLNRKLREVVSCWRRAGHDVRQICGGDLLSNGERASRYGSPEVHNQWLRRARGLKALRNTLSEWRDIQHDRQVLSALDSVCASWHPDVIWERSSRLHYAGLKLSRQLGVPYVLEWKDHLIDYRYSLFRRKALRAEAMKHRHADHVVVESAVLREYLARSGVDGDRIIVAHNAVRPDEFARDLELRARVRQDLGVSSDTVLVGYLGSYAFYHDTARLVLAASIIRERRPPRKIKILMVGAGKEYSDTRALANSLGVLDDSLVMKPGVPQGEVPGVLSALDVAVLPGSTDIICPIKVQEYMASALPSVVPDYACNREVVEDGVTGALFRPKDESSLAEAILGLAASDELRTEMGRRARFEVSRRFTWEATWGRALDSVLAAPPKKNKPNCGHVGST